MSASTELTKGQRRRRNERLRREQQRWWDDKMGTLPRHLANAWGERNTRPEEFGNGASWERAPEHMVDYDECPSLNDGALRKLSKAAGAARACERNVQIAELKAKYPDKWDKRGGAKWIASQETEDGNPISERTVRGYFRART